MPVISEPYEICVRLHLRLSCSHILGHQKLFARASLPILHFHDFSNFEKIFHGFVFSQPFIYTFDHVHVSHHEECLRLQ